MNLFTGKIHLVMGCLLFLCRIGWAANISVPLNTPTISSAMMQAKKGDTITAADGVYREQIFINPGVTLISANLFKSVIDGSGRGTVVTTGNGSTISGFEIRNGTIGIFNTSSNVTITKCRIIYNQQTGIMCVGHIPRIEDNLIVYNRGSGIQGWDVQSSSNTVNHNTISMNNNHGVSIGGNSLVIIENNIISSNDQFGIKAGEEKVRITMISNNFYQNAKFSAILPNDNISTDPMFKNVAQLNFTLCKDSRCLGRGSDNQDIGARLVY
jgi:hypothetical protein